MEGACAWFAQAVGKSQRRLLHPAPEVSPEGFVTVAGQEPHVVTNHLIKTATLARSSCMLLLGT